MWSDYFAQRKMGRLFDALTPQVLSVLERHGEAIWGRNRCCLQRFRVTTGDNRWVLCLKPLGMVLNARYQMPRRVAVEILGSQRFKILSEDALRGETSVLCRDLSESGLVDGLSGIGRRLGANQTSTAATHGH